MVYSIFLLDAFFRGERQKGLSEEQAMIPSTSDAVTSINSIFANSPTSVVGFLALGIHGSLPLDLIWDWCWQRVIVFSLTTVIFFMPGYDSQIFRWNDKTRHRPFLPSFRRFSEWVYRVRYPPLSLLLILAYFLMWPRGMNDFLYGNNAVGASEEQVYADDQVISGIWEEAI